MEGSTQYPNQLSYLGKQGEDRDSLSIGLGLDLPA